MRSTRRCCARARAQMHQGVGALELVGLPGRGARAARQRDRGAALHRPAAAADAAQRVDDHRARVVRAARLPGAHARRQARVAAGAVPAVPRGAGSGRCRPRAPGRPVARSTGAGASCATDADVAPRQADAAARAADGDAAAGADARRRRRRRCGAHERPVRRPRRRRRSGRRRDAVEAGRGVSTRRRRQGLLQPDVYHQARRLAPAGAVAPARARRRPRSPSAWRRTCCSSARRRARPATAPGAAPRRRARRPTSLDASSGRRLPGSAPRPLRPGLDRAGDASAWPRPRKPGRRWPAASCTA